MSNSIPTINIIPADYDGNPRDALGYAWADLDARIPGEDVTLPYTDGIDYRGYVEQRFGPQASIHNNNQYGFLRQPKGRVLARLNCMWCGGLSGVVYAPEGQQDDRQAAYVNPGDTLTETAMRERMAEKADRSEQDARNATHPGYCTKCHSYCYGDCEASQ